MTLCTFLALWTIASIPAALFWIAICKGGSGSRNTGADDA
jgi:hypothetical protein